MVVPLWDLGGTGQTIGAQEKGGNPANVAKWIQKSSWWMRMAKILITRPYATSGVENPVWDSAPRYGVHRESFVRTQETTPIGNIQRRLSEIDPDDTRQRVVLLSTGTFYPIHNGHLRSLAAARSHLEEFCDCVVLGGFISPCHAVYLARKHRKSHEIPDEDRLNLIETSLRGLGFDDWLALDRMEPSYIGPPESALREHRLWKKSSRDWRFVSHRVSVASMKEFLRREFPDSSIRVLFVCGWDHWVSCRKVDQSRLDAPAYGIVVNARTDERVSGLRVLQLPPNGHLHFVPVHEVTAATQELSSTVIRDLLHQGKVSEITEDMMCPEAVQYITDRRLFFPEKGPIHILYSPDEHVVDKRVSVFLAGCTPFSGNMRDGWRRVVADRLQADPRLCHHMTCCIPEPECGDWRGLDFYRKTSQIPGFRQLIWEEVYYEQSSIEAFWMPMYWNDRNSGPHFDANIGPTTRWEFGEAIARFRFHDEDPKFQLVVGSPRDAQKMSWAHRKTENLGIPWHWLAVANKSEKVSGEFITAIVEALLKNKNCDC